MLTLVCQCQGRWSAISDQGWQSAAQGRVSRMFRVTTLYINCLSMPKAAFVQEKHQQRRMLNVINLRIIPG